MRGYSASICSRSVRRRAETAKRQEEQQVGKSRHSDAAALDTWGAELRTCKRSLTLKNNNKAVAYLPLELWGIGR